MGIELAAQDRCRDRGGDRIRDVPQPGVGAAPLVQSFDDLGFAAPSSSSMFSTAPGARTGRTSVRIRSLVRHSGQVVLFVRSWTS